MSAPGVTLLLTTAPSAEAAEEIARPLVERGLAACVSIVPGLRSLFVWKGNVEDEAEVLLLVKTAADVEVVREAIRGLHPYEVPEMLAFPAAWADEAYARWVAEATSGGRKPPEPGPGDA